jgi:hypothetical protein
MHQAMCDHLAEEEQVGLPLLRAAFTSKEYAVPVDKIVATLTPADMAWVVRPLASDAAKLTWMKQVAGVPGPVCSLIMMPAVRRYARDKTAPVAALVAGSTYEPPPRTGCACF